jgi:predicted enzyme related to lactoylglutathione lyase
VNGVGAISPQGASLMTEAQNLVSGVDFVALPTHDLETAVDFYGATLGLRRSVYRKDRHFAEFETGNLTLNIMDAEAMGLEHRTSQTVIALHVDDVAAARSVLAGRGVAFRGDTFDTGVCHMAFFSDPDGNALMLHHRYAPRTTTT